MRFLSSLSVALSMYSKIPVPTVDWNEKNMKHAMCFFPVVGVVTGALEYAAGYVLLTDTECGSFFFAAVMTLIPILVTGGIHMDGFADTMDAISSYGDREKKLAVLKDPHTGAFAVIWLCAYFLVNAALWSEADLSVLPAAALMFPLSRALSGISVVSFTAAKDSGILRTFQDGAQRRRVRIVLLLWAAVCGGGMVWLSPLPGGLALAAALLVFLHYFCLSRKQFGGITGDLAGYFLQVCELAMLAALILVGGCLWK